MDLPTSTAGSVPEDFAGAELGWTPPFARPKVGVGVAMGVDGEAGVEDGGAEHMVAAA